MADRFQVIEGSESGHCCFDATVVDTHVVRLPGSSVKNNFAWVCECMDLDAANTIAELLNRAEKRDA